MSGRVSAVGCTKYHEPSLNHEPEVRHSIRDTHAPDGPLLTVQKNGAAHFPGRSLPCKVIGGLIGRILVTRPRCRERGRAVLKKRETERERERESEPIRGTALLPIALPKERKPVRHTGARLRGVGLRARGFRPPYPEQASKRKRGRGVLPYVPSPGEREREREEPKSRSLRGG